MKKVIAKIVVFSFLSTLPASAQTNVSDLWSQGIEFFGEKDFVRGLEYMQKVINYSPSSATAYYNSAVAKRQLGDYAGACTDYNTAYLLGFKNGKKYSRYLCDEEYKLSILQKYFYEDEKLLPENNNRPAYTRKDTLRGKLREERTCFDVYYYNLSVRVIPKKKRIKGNNKIYFTVVNDTRKIQLDLFDNLDIDSILWKDKKLDYTREFNAVWVNFPEVIIADSKHIIQVFYGGKPRKAPKPPWDGGLVWDKDENRNFYCGVACEQLGASVWWPNKDHLSEKPDSMGINIEVPNGYQAISNGTLRNTLPADEDYTRFEWFVHYPIDNYNVTFYLGKYTNYTDTIYSCNDTLLAWYHVLPYNEQMAREHFKQAREVVDCYNRYFGLFPFWEDKFRMVESPYAGMEHQTAIAYGNAYNNEDNSHNYENNDYDYIIVHEAAHEWWGNAIAVGDMADAWIQEGFATYAEFVFLEDTYTYNESIREMQGSWAQIFNFWPMVENRDVNEDAFASGDIYKKGAALLHNFRCTLQNDSLFFGLLKSFFGTYKFKIVTSDDFINYANQYVGDDYTPLFNKFLYDKDLPVLEYSYKRNKGNLVINYKWIGVENGFKMNFAVDDMKGNYVVLTGTTSTQKVVLENAETFSFYNENKELTLVPKHGVTYYWTKGLNY